VARESDDQTTRRRLAALTGAVFEPEAVKPAPGGSGSLRGAFDPGRPGLKTLAAAAAVVVLGAGAWAWFSRPQPVEIAPAPAAVSAGPAGSGGSAGSAGASGDPQATLVVAVAGKVRKPGLVRLRPDSRVADAIEAAGGVLPGTDLSTVNLARKVVDGELITIGVANTATGGGGAGGAAPDGKVNLNTATAAQLDKLPGVGPVLADRIVAYRDSKGGFRSVSELRQVDGIGDAKYAELKDLVVV
jgi:competence protein ComEA